MTSVVTRRYRPRVVTEPTPPRADRMWTVRDEILALARAYPPQNSAGRAVNPAPVKIRIGKQLRRRKVWR